MFNPVTTPPPGSPAWPLPARSASPPPEADLRHLFTHLQTQIATLQEQVTHLALTLLRERAWRWEERLSPPPAPLPSSAAPHTDRRHDPVPPPSGPRARSRALPLIEYGADGTYLVICPTQGVLSLVPDSPEWFDWLSSLTAFTFQGANGRFSTTRKVRQGQRTPSWNAYRSLHGHSCTLYLGLTSHLTLAHLEHMATTIHARLTTV